MTPTTSLGIEELRRAISGPVIAPGDPDFDARRRVWNAGYISATCGQSIRSAVCSDAITAWMTQAPRPPSATARSSTARPAAIWGMSHRERSWSSSSTRSSPENRARRRAWWIIISASSPCASGSSGMSVPSTWPRRMASAARSTRPL